jgi:hypothetical protein
MKPLKIKDFCTEIPICSVIYGTERVKFYIRYYVGIFAVLAFYVAETSL